MPIYSVNKPYLEFDLFESEDGILTEAIVYKFVKKNDVPDDFKKFAVKFAEDTQKMAGTKMGYGILSDSLGIKFKDIKSKIEKKDKKNCYIISVGLKGVLKGIGVEPTLINRLKASINVIFDFLDKACKAQGMKKISNKVGAWSSYIKQGKDCIYIIDGGWVNGSFSIYIRCLLDTPENREIAAGGKAFVESSFIIGEDASSSDKVNHTKDQLTPNTVGFEGLTPEELYGFNPDLGLSRSEELSNGDYSDFFRDPKIMKAFTEHLDLTDSITRKAVKVMNEAEQNSVLTALTSKLYDNIVSKVDDIDYGEIPSTKGDITKLSNYSRLVECVELLKKILKEFRQDTKPIDEIEVAISNISTHKDTFMKAYKFNCELPIIMYNNAVLSVITAVSYMIATSIEFMKTPNQDNFQITLDKVAYAKTKSNILYNNLKKFNSSVKSGEFDKAMNHILQNRIKRLDEAAAAITAFAAIGGVVGVIAIITHIIPILREMVFFFYYTRMRVSDFFDIQADLLQMNAYNLENNDTKSEDEKERIVSKQLKIVELFRKAANKISFTGKKAEVDSTKEITASSKKMKLNDIADELPDSVSALF